MESPTPGQHPRALRARAARLLLDGVVPVLVAAALSAVMFRHVLSQLDRVVLGPLLEAQASDLNGTIWFYAWMERAVSRGLPILQPSWVCWPGGQNLGRAFPNRIDAWVAMPLMHFLPFPANFNVYATLVPVLGTVAGYAFFRSLTTRWWLALAAAIVFGFERYVFYELGAGRPVTALIATLPLFFAAWWRALGAPATLRALGWAAVAGAAAGLVARSYAPWTLWAGAVGVALALARVAFPVPGAWRARPIGLGLVALAVALVVTAPYLHELLVIRTGRGAMYGAPLPPWDARVWIETWATLRATPPGVRAFSAGGASHLENVVAFDALWRPDAAGADRALLSWAFVAVLAAACSFGGRAAIGWTVLGLLGWTSLAGADPERLLAGAPSWVQAIGPWLPRPAAWLLDAAPGLGEHLRPYRGAPVATLALAAAVVMGWEGLARRSARRGRAGVVARALGGAAVVGLALSTGWTAVAVDGGRVPVTEWRPSPFYRVLAAMPAGSPGAGAIIDLPMGLGHAFGPTQLVHQHARADFALDTVGVGYAGPAPEPQVWLRPLRAFGIPGVPPPASSWKDDARASGFDWVIVHLSGYKHPDIRRAAMDLSVVRAWLTSELGAPAWADREVEAYAL